MLVDNEMQSRIEVLNHIDHFQESAVNYNPTTRSTPLSSLGCVKSVRDVKNHIVEITIDAEH